MEAAIQTVVSIFLKSAKGKEGLGSKQFQSLVESQLGNILTGTESSEAIKEMRQGLDSNKDGKVGFEEYMKLVGYCAVSLSEQRTLDKTKVEPAQNSAAAQVAQSAPATAEEKPEAKAEANAEAKEESKPEAKEEATPVAKEEATPEAKEEAKQDAKVEVSAEANVEPKVEEKVEAKAEEATQPVETKVEDKPAAVEVVAAVAAVAAPAAEEVKEPEKVEEAGKVEEKPAEEAT